jgi:hypothetical protein
VRWTAAIDIRGTGDGCSDAHSERPLGSGRPVWAALLPLLSRGRGAARCWPNAAESIDRDARRLRSLSVMIGDVVRQRAIRRKERLTWRPCLDRIRLRIRGWLHPTPRNTAPARSPAGVAGAGKLRSGRRGLPPWPSRARRSIRARARTTPRPRRNASAPLTRPGRDGLGRRPASAGSLR